MKRGFLLPILSAATAAGLFAQTPLAPVQPKARPAWELEWAYLSKYHDDNGKLGAPGIAENRVVFMGDSITEGWGGVDPAYFPKRSHINRGISGQTTSQMLVRFRADVIGLSPAVVVILGGTNDIAENGGITTVEAIEDNLHSMVDLAKLYHIRVVLCSVLPTLDYPWRPGLKPALKILALNRWMQQFCEKNHLVYLDYYSAMVGPDGALKPGLSRDGVHPNAAGYAIMEPLADEAIRAAAKL